MSTARQKEAYPLMDKSLPTPAMEPGLQPPPYSSVIGFESQEYSPMPPVSARVPYPAVAPQMPAPLQQEASPYSYPVNRAFLENGNAPPPQSVYNPTTVRTVHVIPSTQGAMPNRMIIVTSQSGSPNRRKKCRYMKMFSVIGIILVAVTVGTRMYQRSRHRREMKERVNQKWLQEELHQRHQRYAPDVPNDLDELQREVNSIVNQQQNYQSRSKRSFDAFQRHYKDYDFDGLNDAVIGMMNTMAESGKVVTEQPRNARNKNWSLYRLFKRNAYGK